MTVRTFDEIFRDYVIDGVPSSGAHKPIKVDIRDTLNARLPFSNRERLTSGRTYYVRTDGDDSNTGLINSPSGAFQTLQGAADAIYKNIDLNGVAVTIQVASGTYTSGVTLNGAAPGSSSPSSLTFRGNTTTPGNVIVSVTNGNCFTAQYGGKAHVEGFRMGTTTAGRCLSAYAGGEITFQLVEFGTCAGPHKETVLGGRIANNGNYSIIGSAESHDHCTVGGMILVTSTITLVGTPNFSAYYCGVNGACAVQYSGVTFIGSATGQKFVAHQTGSIYTGTDNWNFLPGSTAGGAYGGAVYDDSSQRFLNGAFPSQPHNGTGTVSAAFTDAALGANVMGLFNYAVDSNAPILSSSKSRGGSVGAHGLVVNGDLASERRVSVSNGTTFVNGLYERIALEGVLTTGATFAPMGYRLSLSPDESTAPIESYRMDRLGNPYFPRMGTTASAGNCFVNNASTPVANQLMRSTSSARYKRDIEDIDLEYSLKLLNEVRPKFFRSAVETDNQEYSHWGLIAEDVAPIDPRLVHFSYRDEDFTEDEETGNRTLNEGAELVPDGVQYDRFVPHLLVLVKYLMAKVEKLEARK